MPTHDIALSPLKTNICNPNTRDSTSIVLRISENPDDKIQFPKFNRGSNMSIINENVYNTSSKSRKFFQMYGEQLMRLSKHDPLHEMTIQEKDLVWKGREYCLENTHYKRILPKIIDCVDYADRAQVVELHCLLDRWPLLSPEDALQLFDFYYPDEYVRSYAVKGPSINYVGRRGGLAKCLHSL